MEKPVYLSGYLEKKGDKGLLKAWQVRWFQQEGANLFYYDDKHFTSTGEAHGHIDLASVVSVEALPPAQKKDKAKIISISTKFGRTFLLREPNDDVRKAQEWVTRIDDWRKWIKDGGSASPPLPTKQNEELSPRSSSTAEIKPLARGLSGAVERSKLMMKKSVQGMGTLVSTTVAKKAEEQDAELEGVKKCGWLVKKGQKRWFAIKDGALLWFKEPQVSASSVTKDNSAGFLPLKEGCIVRKVQDKSSLVVISPSGKPYELVAYDNPTRDVWLQFLTDACGGVRARAPTIKTPQKLKGWLKRKGGPGKLKPWKKIYVAQQENELLMFESDDMSKESLGSVNLFDISNVETTYDDGVSPTFEVRTSHGIFYFCALSEDDLEYWTAGLAQFWEQKRGVKSKGPQPPIKKPLPAETTEVRVTETLIVKTPIATVDEESEKRKQVLDALENSSEEDYPQKGVAVKAQRMGEPDEDFDSLMDALGSEKSKLSMRASTQNKKNPPIEDEEELMNEMYTAASKNARKPTVIKTETTSTEFSASGRIMRKEEGLAMQDKQPKESPASLDRLSQLLDDDDSDKGKTRGSNDSRNVRPVSVAEFDDSDNSFEANPSAPAPKAEAINVEFDDDSFEKPPPQKSSTERKTTLSSSTKVVGKVAPVTSPAVTPASGKLVDDLDFEDDQVPANKATSATKLPVVAATAATSNKLPTVTADKAGPKTSSGAVAPAKLKVQPKVEDDMDDFSVPSFGFSDDEDAPPPVPKPAAKTKTMVLDAAPKAESVAKAPAPKMDESASKIPAKAVPKEPEKTASKIEEPAPKVPVKVAAKEPEKPPVKVAAVVPEKPAAKAAAVVTPAKPSEAKPKTMRVKKAKAGPPWVVGDRLMALFHEDDLWYKARVTKVAGSRFWVEFLGYGNVQECDDDTVLPIPEDELTDGDEVEVPLNDDPDDHFNQELESMLSLPPQPNDSDESDSDERLLKARAAAAAHSDDDEDEDLPVPPPPPGDDSDSASVSPRPKQPAFDSDDSDGPQPPKKGVPAAAKAGPTVKKAASAAKVAIPTKKPVQQEFASSFGDDDDEEVVAKAKPAAVSGVSAAERKKAVAASQKGPDKDKSGLFEAAAKGDLKMLKAILAEGVYVDYQKRKEPKGWSALHFAVQAGQVEAVELLLQKGADPNLLDAREKPVLHKAVGENGKVAIVKKLLDAKADVFATSETGDCVLHEARSVECVQLIFKSIDKSGRLRLLGEHGQNGYTPLHMAATIPANRDMCAFFLENDPEGLNVEDTQGESPLFAAARAEALQPLALLLESGADISLRNIKSLTVFHVALNEGKDLALELLMSSSLITEDLVNDLVERQLDLQMDANLSNVESEGDDEDEEETKKLRLSVVRKFVALFKKCFSKKAISSGAQMNYFFQILSTLRLGEEYLLAQQFYYQAVVCLNAARALCQKHQEEGGVALKLLSEAIGWHVTAILKKTRYARNDRQYAQLTLSDDDDFVAFQKRHYQYLGKVNLSAPTNGDLDKAFPSYVLDALSELFEEEW